MFSQVTCNDRMALCKLKASHGSYHPPRLIQRGISLPPKSQQPKIITNGLIFMGSIETLVISVYLELNWHLIETQIGKNRLDKHSH